MRIPKIITNLENKIDSLRSKQNDYLKDELYKARDDYDKAIDSALLGKCFIRKYNKSKYKTSWSYVKFTDRDEENLICSIRFPYLFSEEDCGSVGLSVDFIYARDFGELCPISEEKFQSKLTEILGIITSVAKRSDNGNA